MPRAAVQTGYAPVNGLDMDRADWLLAMIGPFLHPPPAV
jgi:hypothetical protein